MKLNGDFKRLQVRIQLVREGGPVGSSSIGGPKDVAELLGHLRSEDREHFICIYLNAANNILGVETVSVGSLTASIVHPRECLKAAILLSAAGIILAHNHPSGNCQPSPEDKQTTRRMVEAGNLIGIPVLDHIIIADDDYYSFRDAGVI